MPRWRGRSGDSASAYVLAALGGFVFAFGLPRLTQIGHQQLLPHLFAPWAIWHVAIPRTPAIGSLAGVLAASYLQILSSIYLGLVLAARVGDFRRDPIVIDRGMASKSGRSFDDDGP